MENAPIDNGYNADQSHSRATDNHNFPTMESHIQEELTSDEVMKSLGLERNLTTEEIVPGKDNIDKTISKSKVNGSKFESELKESVSM